VAVIVLLGVAAFAQSTPAISSQTADAFSKLKGDAKVRQALEFIQKDDANTLNEQKVIVAIPAPPYKEKVRGEYYMKRLQSLDLKNVQTDSEGNVCGIRPGTGSGPRIFVEAHLDTVSPKAQTPSPWNETGRFSLPASPTTRVVWPQCYR
jgi:tripeptide aminopeptidase